MTGAQALARFRAAYDDRAGEAQRRKAGGSTIIGYFLNSVPTELVLAAGLDPLRLVGDPGRRAPVADKYMEEYFDGEIRSLFGSLIEGEFDFVDLIVIPRSSEVYLQLYYFLREMPNWEPDARIPPTYLFDLLQTPHWTTAQYDLGRMHALAKRLEDAGGRPIDSDGIREAIATVNRLRALLVEASALWQGEQPSLDGVDALKVIGAASVLAPAEAIANLAALIADPPSPIAARRPRILLKGSPQSDPRVTALIETAGGGVVAHDHIAGDRTYDRPVSEDGDPWEALVHHYQLDIPGPRAYPQIEEDEAFVGLAERAQVDGVVFFHDEWDDTLGWEYPDQKRLLDHRNIASLYLKRQPYFDPPADAQREAISAFVSSLAKVTA